MPAARDQGNFASPQGSPISVSNPAEVRCPQDLLRIGTACSKTPCPEGTPPFDQQNLQDGLSISRRTNLPRSRSPAGAWQAHLQARPSLFTRTPGRWVTSSPVGSPSSATSPETVFGGIADACQLVLGPGVRTRNGEDHRQSQSGLSYGASDEKVGMFHWGNGGVPRMGWPAPGCDSGRRREDDPFVFIPQGGLERLRERNS